MSDELRAAQGRRPIFVDTDAGCDDVLALTWLLRRPDVEVLGLSSVFGNSSVQNTTANLLTLLAALDLDLPVTMGASAPLVYPRTGAGALTHGPDGLWGAQEPHSLAGVAQGAPGAIAAAARSHPGLTLITLGPLTNVARAVQAYPDDMAGVRVVVLAGAAGAGSITPAAEFNAFADPHALQIVLDSPLTVELLTRDAFKGLLLDVGLIPRLKHECGAAGRLLARIVQSYSRAVMLHGGPLGVPDAAAAIYALHPELGEAVPATVRVVTEGELTRGQTIVALSPRHQAALALGVSGVEQLATSAADPDFDYGAALREASARAPHNARVVLQIDAGAMSRVLHKGLLGLSEVRAVGG